MQTGLLHPLEPELIGGIFGRKPSLAESSPLGRLRPRARLVLIALAGAIVILLLAGLEGALLPKSGVPSALLLLFKPKKTHLSTVALPLMEDPVGLIVIAMVLATPIFCYEQLDSIRNFVPMNERNIKYRFATLQVDLINQYAARANKRYLRIGSRGNTIAVLLVSGAASFVLDVFISRLGLLASWNPSTLSTTAWRKLVYAGWWGSPARHIALAAVIWLLGTYFFYFLYKQLVVGFIFTLYVRSVLHLDFGVTPNMSYNSDGYWGLRPLRYFMQWTYCSTLGDFVMTLGMFVIWFPFGIGTVLVVLAVMFINSVTVIYPSLLAMRGTIREKELYVLHIMQSRLARADRTTAIDNVWSSPSLPFHIRSTLTAATIYLLIPLLLALVSSLLTR